MFKLRYLGEAKIISDFVVEFVVLNTVKIDLILRAKICLGTFVLGSFKFQHSLPD